MQVDVPDLHMETETATAATPVDQYQYVRSMYREDEERFKRFLDEESERTERALTRTLTTTFTALSNTRIEKYEKYAEKRRTEEIKTLQKLVASTETKKQRREELDVPLEDRLATAEVDSPTAAEVDSPTADSANAGNQNFNTDSPTADSANAGNQNFKTDSPTADSAIAANQFFNTDTDVASAPVPFLKSAMKKPVPPYKPKSPIIARVIDFMSGNSEKKKKKRTSFGGVDVRIYTPSVEEVSDKNAAVLQNLGDGPTFPVVICDMPVYKQWRKYSGGQFVRNFNDCATELAADPDIALQTLHAGRVMGLLRSLDQEKLRNLARATFPKKYNRCFPRLTDKHGACQKDAFLEYLEKRLDAHAAFMETKEDDPEEPKWCFEDCVKYEERHHHGDEYHHIE